MKKKILVMTVLCSVALLFVGCHKQCNCTGYNSFITTYTAEEVEAQGGNCASMVYQADVRYYAYCEWE